MRNIWRALNSDDLKKMGAAVDEEATQDTENQSYGDERPPSSSKNGSQQWPQ